MPSTHLNLNFHLVFSTKNREGLILPEFEEALHAYLGGCLRFLGAVPRSIGGVEDHSHLLAGLRATHRLADVMREIKGASSEWVHKEVGFRRFAWQEGYGAFTVSESSVPGVKRYIANQREHHKKLSFQDEYRLLLTKNEISFDEKYLW